MKKYIILSFIIGLFLGLFLSGLFWSNKYIALYEKYYNAIELIKLIKLTL